MLRTLLAYGVLSLAASGCAELSYGSPQVHDSVLRTRQAIKPGPSVRAGFEQTGTQIEISTYPQCNMVEVREIKRTTTYEKENPAIVPELILLGLGSVPAGLGVAFLVDAKSVYESDRNARLYNASGPEGALAAGVVLLAFGGAMVSVPLVDFARSIGTKEEETEVTEEGAIIQPDVPCEGGTQPASYRSVTGRSGPHVFSLGQTDSAGTYRGDLVTTVPPFIFELNPPPASIEVWVDNTRVGKAQLDGVGKAQAEDRRRRDEEAWRAIDLAGCRHAKVEEACDPVREYINQFPNGAHIEEARRLLDPSSRVTQVQIAASPEDIAKAEAARKAAEAATEAAKKAGAEACRKKCEASCKKEAVCTKGCVEGACQ